MIKTDKINAVELKPISFNTVTVKDFASFVDNTSEDYFALSRKYLDKLYKSIDIGSYQFVKKLHSIDPSYCIDLITRKMTSTQFNVYELPNHDYILASDQFIDSYTSILELSEGKFDTIYENFSNKKATHSLLQYNQDTSTGIYFNFDFKYEDVHAYRVNVANESNESYFVFDRVGTFKMTDPATVTYLKDEINTTRNTAITNDIDNYKLTWFEIKKLCKVYKLDKTLFMDDTTDSVLKDKDIDIYTNESATSVIDFAKYMFEHIDEFDDPEYFYSKLQKQEFFFANR